MCFKKRIVLCREGLKVVDVLEEMRQEEIRKDRKLRVEMLEEQGLKLLPEGHGTRFGSDGEWKVLAYEYREDTYIGEGNIEYLDQNWRYYYWCKIIKRWTSACGHRQTMPLEWTKLTA